MRGITYLDNNNTFTKAQVDKLNSVLRTQYNTFVNKTRQGTAREEVISSADIAKTQRVMNLVSYEYNTYGYASFNLNMFGFIKGTRYPVITLRHDVEGSISYSGSTYSDGFFIDSISDYGTFYSEGSTVYFYCSKTNLELFSYPRCTLTWRYE